KCNVDVRGTATLCPLCQSKLKGSETEDIYPKVPSLFKEYEIFFKFLILLSVAGSVICVAINLMIPQSGYWSVFVLLSVACFWITFMSTVKKREAIPANITIQVVLVSVFCVLWDYITVWRGWSLDYAIPCICTVGMVSMAVTARVTKIPIGDYIASFIMDICFGIVPIIFYLTGVLEVQLPSLICVALSIISLVTIVLFEGKNMRLELTKRLHL
ncbi:MAG: DUF6320 domain-containing protein, partial [Oscillospiraceae bacterium]